MSENTWESARSWHRVRCLVYYLLEDLVPPEMAAGADILDFSAGLGDLSRYMTDAGARSVLATRPEPESGDDGVEWLTGVAAGNVVQSLGGRTFDLVVARMVFQFPTWEGDRADPDTMSSEFAEVIRPGGRLVAAFHEFVATEDELLGADIPDVEDVLASRPDLAQVVRFLDLPPREGPFGQTGFGLKIPMFINSVVGNGFAIESTSHVEPFTFPLNLDQYSDADLDAIVPEVIEIKRRWLAHVSDPYAHPSAIRQMLSELALIMPHIAWPIVRVVARRL